jgi:hypothetical protein
MCTLGLIERPLPCAQEITDTVGLRRRIGECFELAALPGTPEADRKKALNFCVVGGGPTGARKPPMSPLGVLRSTKSGLKYSRVYNSCHCNVSSNLVLVLSVLKYIFMY